MTPPEQQNELSDAAGTVFRLLFGTGVALVAYVIVFVPAFTIVLELAAPEGGRLAIIAAPFWAVMMLAMYLAQVCSLGAVCGMVPPVAVMGFMAGPQFDTRNFIMSAIPGLIAGVAAARAVLYIGLPGEEKLVIPSPRTTSHRDRWRRF